MSHYRLIFHPLLADQEMDNDTVYDCLSSLEFIQPGADAGNHYLAGEQFLSLLTFLGCSPNINLSPDEGESYCSIKLIEAQDTAVCLGHMTTAKPKCPACKKRIGNWQTTYWQQPEQSLACDKCGKPNRFSELNWKHECAYARGGFVVDCIYPHEAVPNEQLLKALQDHTGFAWSYSYADSPSV